MLKTNINIQRGRQKLKYGVEYVDNQWKTDLTFAEWQTVTDPETDAFQFVMSGAYNCSRTVNTWSHALYGYGTVAEMPDDGIDVSSFYIYFPQHSVETYSNNNYYIVEFTTFVNGDKIVLGCFLIDRRDAIAYPGIKIINGERYYEYLQVKVPDPWNIAYSDEWARFRQNICGEPSGINNTGSLVSINMHPVFWNGEQWEKCSEFIGGSNTILISDKITDYLAPVLSYDSDEANPAPSVWVKFRYNDAFDTLADYISETYQMQGQIDARTSVILHDGENVYDMWIFTGTADEHRLDLWSGDQIIKFDAWESTDSDGNTVQNWKPGLMFTAYLSIYNDDEPAVSVASNNLPLTMDAFASLIPRPSNVPASFDLQDLDSQGVFDISINGQAMTEVNIVNKINKNIVNIQRPDAHRNSVARPVFVKVKDNGSDIQIHPGVTENIGINLQKYKSQVKLFTMKVAGVEFPEVGRIGANVVFKLNAGSLPEDIAAGLYYILDDNKELVTFGNYTV